MSTRAVYTFKNTDDTFHVYKHRDGYPSDAALAISKSLKLSWELPRFEPDEFGAAFIAANKLGSGHVRLCHSYEDFDDLSYRYEITFKDGSLNVVAYRRILGGLTIDSDEEIQYEIIFSGSLDEFKEFALGKS